MPLNLTAADKIPPTNDIYTFRDWKVEADLEKPDFSEERNQRHSIALYSSTAPHYPPCLV